MNTIKKGDFSLFFILREYQAQSVQYFVLREYRSRKMRYPTFIQFYFRSRSISCYGYLYLKNIKNIKNIRTNM